MKWSSSSGESPSRALKFDEDFSFASEKLETFLISFFQVFHGDPGAADFDECRWIYILEI